MTHIFFLRFFASRFRARRFFFFGKSFGTAREPFCFYTRVRPESRGIDEIAVEIPFDLPSAFFALFLLQAPEKRSWWDVSFAIKLHAHRSFGTLWNFTLPPMRNRPVFIKSTFKLLEVSRVSSTRRISVFANDDTACILRATFSVLTATVQQLHSLCASKSCLFSTTLWKFFFGNLWTILVALLHNCYWNFQYMGVAALQ